jgi:hypothetical protein
VGVFSKGTSWLIPVSSRVPSSCLPFVCSASLSWMDDTNHFQTAMEKAYVTDAPSRVTPNTTSSSSFNGGNSGAIVRRLASPSRVPLSPLLPLLHRRWLNNHKHKHKQPEPALCAPSTQTRTLQHRHRHPHRTLPTRTTDTPAISLASSAGVPKERLMIPWKKKSPWSSVWGAKNGSTRDVW